MARLAFADIVFRRYGALRACSLCVCCITTLPLSCTLRGRLNVWTVVSWMLAPVVKSRSPRVMREAPREKHPICWWATQRKNIYCSARRTWRSCRERRAARLDGLNLGRGQGLAVEACREIVAVEEDALRSGDRAEVRASSAANAGGLDGLAKRPELLGVVTVGAERRVGRGGEGFRQGVGGRSGMGLGRVVDGCCQDVKSASASETLAPLFAIGGVVTYQESCACR